MDLKHFQSRTVWIKIAQMHGIAVTETYAVEHLTVVIEGGRAPNDFIFAVTVDIGNRHVVVAVGIHRVAFQT